MRRATLSRPLAPDAFGAPMRVSCADMRRARSSASHSAAAVGSVVGKLANTGADTILRSAHAETCSPALAARSVHSVFPSKALRRCSCGHCRGAGVSDLPGEAEDTQSGSGYRLPNGSVAGSLRNGAVKLARATRIARHDFDFPSWRTNKCTSRAVSQSITAIHRPALIRRTAARDSRSAAEQSHEQRRA